MNHKKIHICLVCFLTIGLSACHSGSNDAYVGLTNQCSQQFLNDETDFESQVQEAISEKSYATAQYVIDQFRAHYQNVNCDMGGSGSSVDENGNYTYYDDSDPIDANSIIANWQNFLSQMEAENSAQAGASASISPTATPSVSPTPNGGLVVGTELKMTVVDDGMINQWMTDRSVMQNGFLFPSTSLDADSCTLTSQSAAHANDVVYLKVYQTQTAMIAISMDGSVTLTCKQKTELNQAWSVSELGQILGSSASIAITL